MSGIEDHQNWIFSSSLIWNGWIIERQIVRAHVLGNVHICG